MQYYDQQECLFFKFNVTHTMIEILRPCHNIYWIYTKRISDMVMEIKTCIIQFFSFEIAIARNNLPSSYCIWNVLFFMIF